MKVTIEAGRIIQPYAKANVSGEFELTSYKKQRSSGQNKYLHKILFPMIAEGMSKIMKKPITNEFAKSVVKFKFLQMFTDAGTVILPTSKMNTKQCSKFVEDCQRWASEMLHINVPSPNEEDYSQLTKE